MFQSDLHPRLAPRRNISDAAYRDAHLAFQIDAMMSRRPRRPISLPRPPFTRGR